MKRKDFLSELRGLSIDDLKGQEVTLSEELMKLRFNHAVGNLQQKHLLSKVKRNIARVKTVLKERSGANL